MNANGNGRRHSAPPQRSTHHALRPAGLHAHPLGARPPLPLLGRRGSGDGGGRVRRRPLPLLPRDRRGWADRALEGREARVEEARQFPLPNEPAIALVVGYDKRKGVEADTAGSRSDTLMLLRADPVTNSISMLSFPRDLQAQLWCDGKIVGTDPHQRRVLGLRLEGDARDREAPDGVADQLPDHRRLPRASSRSSTASGGVDRRRRRYYNKNLHTAGTNFADINLWPGYQKLNGAKALDYVRFRHTDSDLFRIARQQQSSRASSCRCRRTSPSSRR